jgi:hypothetical protein
LEVSGLEHANRVESRIWLKSRVSQSKNIRHTKDLGYLPFVPHVPLCHALIGVSGKGQYVLCHTVYSCFFQFSLRALPTDVVEFTLDLPFEFSVFAGCVVTVKVEVVEPLQPFFKQAPSFPRKDSASLTEVTTRGS